MNFVKMHGTGNDFVIVEGARAESDSTKWPSIAQSVCSRRFGVGADGILVVRPSDTAALRMQIFNPDGSEAEMCGNGIRCVAKYAVERGLIEDAAATNGDGVHIETLAGVMTVWPLHADDASPRIDAVRVAMGAPVLTPREIPVALDGPEPIANYALDVGGHSFRLSFVSMGNPHAIAFLDTPVEAFPLETVGPEMEHHPLYPERVNFEIANLMARDRMSIRVWERGAGLTMACGTGACAAVVAARINGLVDDCVSVDLPGGTLTIEWDGDPESPVYMTGPAASVYAGTLSTD